MDWKLDDGRPIWTQLAEQLTRQIVLGRISARQPSALGAGAR